MKRLIILLLFLFIPLYAYSSTEITEVIIEVPLIGDDSENAIQDGLRKGLILAAEQLSSDKLNSKIADYYKKMLSPDQKGYIQGYNIISRHKDEFFQTSNLVLKVQYFSSPIRNDILNFGMHQSRTESNETVFLITTKLPDSSVDAVIRLSDIISEEFELNNINSSFLVKGEDGFEEDVNLHKKFNANVIIMTNLTFLREEDGIRGFLTYKVVNKSNVVTKAMSFSEVIDEDGGNNVDELVQLATRRLMKKMFLSYQPNDPRPFSGPR